MDALSAFRARSLRGDVEPIMLRHGGQEGRPPIGSPLQRRPSNNQDLVGRLITDRGDMDALRHVTKGSHPEWNVFFFLFNVNNRRVS